MDPIDFNHKLDSARQNYHKSIKQVRDDYAEKVEDLAENHKYQREKQAQVYKDGVNKLEEQTRETTDQYRDRVQRAIAQKNKDFSERFEKQREDHELSSRAERQKMAENLDQLKDSFARSKTEDKRLFDESTYRNKQMTNKSLEQMRERNQEAISEISQGAEEKFQELRQKEQADKSALVKKQHEKLGRLEDKNTKARKLERLNHQDEVVGLQKAYAEKERDIQGQYSDRLENVNEKHSDKVNKHAQEYQKLGQMMSDRNVADQTRNNIEHNQELRDIEDRAAKKIKEMRRNTGNQTAALENQLFTMRDAGHRQDADYQRKLQHMQNTTEQGLNDQRSQTNKLTRDFQNALKKQSEDFTAAKEKKAYEHHQDVVKLSGKYMAGKDGASSSYRNKIRELENYFEGRLNSERKISNNTLDNQRQEFSKAIGNLTEGNERLTEEMKNAHAEEKRAVMEQMSQEMYKQTNNLRESLVKRYETKEKGLERKLIMEKGDSEKHINFLNDKIDLLKNKFSSELEMQSKLFQAQRDEEQRGIKNLIELKDEEHYRRLLGLKNEFDRELLSTKNNGAKEKEMIIQQYETRLQEMRFDHNRDVGKKVSELQERYDRMQRDYQTQLSSMRDQYELKLDKLRQANQDARKISDSRNA